MRKFNNENEYIEWLEEELNRIRGAFITLAQSISVSKQCIIEWRWGMPTLSPEGEMGEMKIVELINIAIRQGYRIISVVVEEYDETGSALHATIVALAPENGKLH